MRQGWQVQGWAAMTFGDGAVRRQRLRVGGRLAVAEWERAVLVRRGRVVGSVSGGSPRVWRRAVEALVVDLRPWVLTVPGQEVPTADGVAVKVTVAGQARAVDAERVVRAHQDVAGALHLAVQLALREVLAGVTVESLLTGRAELGRSLLAAVRGLDELGVVLDRLDVRDVVLPAELKRAQAQVLLARAEGQAALERARGETAALRALANAARLADEHPSLVPLRLLQQLGASSGHTVVLGHAGLTP